jgi:hypothetical protein
MKYYYYYFLNFNVIAANAISSLFNVTYYIFKENLLVWSTFDLSDML